MKKFRGYVLGILFFGTVWGASEAILGGALYHWHVRFASVILTVVALAILTVASVHLPQPGSITLIASCAVLYRFLNTGPYLCHLLAIFLLGVAYDALRSTIKLSDKPLPRASLLAVAATYLGHALFAFTITYVFKYHWWAQAGWPRIVNYIGISGTMAAAAGALVAPASLCLGRNMKDNMTRAFEFSSKPAGGGIFAVIAALWVVCMTVSI